MPPFDSGAGFAPIRDFNGTLDGGYHRITGLRINYPGTWQVGLFGLINQQAASITRLGLENVSIIAGGQSGPLGGWLGPNVVIEQVWATGSVNALEQVGGLVGAFSGTMKDVFARVNLTAQNQAGGLVGQLSGRIADGYAAGNVQGGGCGGGCGGLVGLISGSASNPPAITNTFAAGSVTGTGYLGGVVGRTFFAFPTTNTYFDLFRTGRSLCLGEPAANPTGCSGVNGGNSTPDYWFTRVNPPMSAWSSPPWVTRSGDYPILAASGPPLRCVGFAAPVGSAPVTLKKNRALPLKGELRNAEDQLVTDLMIAEPPVVQVIYVGSNGEPPLDVSADALPAGLGTLGNQFVFKDLLWQFNLKMTNFTATGRYLVSMTSGNTADYAIAPTCQGEFVIQ